ncbi:hypothetical protein [Streptomyces spectabilis]|uniref:Uncharacterized protein n=1 Tax=Streptomyces spectabilis TaxID=68270 RepID=A0A516R8W3_STRST|nr:hypothetical protein [Streptomyces spectabilis]QDQ12096.1 hypothetical protein FH965_17170 [Streptomyces spectabilis]
MTVAIGLLGVVLGGLLGAVGSYVTTRSGLLLQLEHAYDVTLRDRRLDRYERLFHVSRCVPRYWPEGEEPSRADLVRFREEFHDWYFGEEAGGMYLTPAAKELYLALQNALFEGMRTGTGESDDSPVPAVDSEAIRRCASELRHQLVEDVGVAQPPRMRWVRVSRTEPPRGHGA